MNLSFNVLNQAMLTQVLHELRLGNLQRCKALGLSEDDIYLLQSLPPTTLSRLAHATVPWVEVKIDSPVLHRLIEQSERALDQPGAQARCQQHHHVSALRLGAFGNRPAPAPAQDRNP